jgi:CheY-like chemotaxis protein
MAHVVAFAAPKGGTGCTTLALAIATALRKLHGPKVVLVEGDLMFGDLSAMVGLRPDCSLLDILDRPRPWGPSTVKHGMLHHPILDFDVVLAPAESHLAEKVTAKCFSDILGCLEQSHDFILVDVATNISDREAEIFDRASAIYLVTAPDPVSVYSTRRLAQVLSLLQKPIEKTALLLNHAPESPCNLSEGEVSAGVGLTVTQQIPRGQPDEFTLESLKLLEPDAPWGDAQKAICKFTRELRSALWTGKPAPGTLTNEEVSAPSFNPFVAVAGRVLESSPTPKMPPLPKASPPPGASPKGPSIPPRRPDPKPAKKGRTTGRDKLRQTLSERLRISRAIHRGEMTSGDAGPAPEVPEGKVGILVADDNESFRTGLCRALGFEDRLHVVAEAADGQQAVDLARSHRPQVVLLDANMPVLGGVEAAKMIRHALPDVLVLMMSVQGEEHLIEEAKAAGVARFLLKPFEPEDVSQAVAECLPG